MSTNNVSQDRTIPCWDEIKKLSIEDKYSLIAKIEDYSKDANLRPLIREYYNAMDEYVRMKNINLFVQNRVFL